MKDFVCEEVKSKFETKEIEFLNYIIQSEQIKKNSKRQTQSETDLCKMSQESTSLSGIDELLLKVCT
jgi:hypothetical protein